MPPSPTRPSSANFAFLAVHDPLLDHLGALAERYFAGDPSTSLMKLRQFGEVLAQRTAANAGEHLRDAGLASFWRLRDDGPLYAQIADAIDAAVKAGHLDRPKRGQVRARKPDATAYTADDWRHALLAVLGPSPSDREDAIRAAAEWARDTSGLEFTRLRADGHIIMGLRSALNRAIRRGEVERHGADRIARAIAPLPEGQLSFTGMSPDRDEDPR